LACLAQAGAQAAVNKRTVNRADEAENTGIMPLEVQLRTMREYWRQAHRGGKFNSVIADKAAALAAQCAPYLHPRLHAIDAKIETALVVMTEDERREQARQAIAEAFAERPLKLIGGEVIEADAAETLASERASVDESVGRACGSEANSLESRDE
jgi:hypothetical protein